MALVDFCNKKVTVLLQKCYLDNGCIFIETISKIKLVMLVISMLQIVLVTRNKILMFPHVASNSFSFNIIHYLVENVKKFYNSFLIIKQKRALILLGFSSKYFNKNKYFTKKWLI